MLTKIVMFYLNVFLVFVTFDAVHGFTKVFKYDTDIFNKKNWKTYHKRKEDCAGLVFPETLDEPLVVDSVAGSLILPKNGKIILDQGMLHFPKSTTNMDCVELTDFELHWWEDPESWITEEISYNPSRPDAERIPCQYDDVIFPKGEKHWTAMYFYEPQTMRSLKFGNKLINSQEGVERLEQELSGKEYTFPIQNIRVLNKDKQCSDPSGCTCNNKYTESDVCVFHYMFQKAEPVYCENPIVPIGFCYEICGASLLLKYKDGFILEEFRTKLNEYGSFTYASKVFNDTVEVIQVVFTEQEFYGNSVEEAEDLYYKVLSDESFKIAYAELSTSSMGGTLSKQIASMFFGTLFGVMLLLIVIFFTNSAIFFRLASRTRFNSNSLRAHLSAKYDAMEDRGLIFDNRSMAGSVVTLDKTSFDNPMFGKITPSTSASINEECSKSESTYDNPLYDLGKEPSEKQPERNGQTETKVETMLIDEL